MKLNSFYVAGSVATYVDLNVQDQVLNAVVNNDGLESVEVVLDDVQVAFEHSFKPESVDNDNSWRTKSFMRNVLDTMLSSSANVLLTLSETDAYKTPTSSSPFCEHIIPSLDFATNDVVRDVFLSQQTGLGIVSFEPNQEAKLLENALRQIICHPLVKYVENDQIVRRDPEVLLEEPAKADYFTENKFYLENDGEIQAPNDPGYSKQWYLKSARFDRAWSLIMKMPAEYHVAMVIDSGLKVSHPDISSNVFVNLAELNGLPGVDDDGNGYIDDVNGISFIDGFASSDVSDTDGHGTFCAGELAAIFDNKLGISGAGGPNIKILPCKFMKTGYGLLSDAARCIDYGIKMNVSVISASWGGASSPGAVQAAIRRARNIMFVSSAGNSGKNLNISPVYPACTNYPNTVTVASTDSSRQITSWSNYGNTCVHLAAPGDHIHSIGIGSSGYEYRTGTSMSAPLVAATNMLMLQANPNLSTAQRVELLRANVDKDAALANATAWSGHLNVYKAVLAAKSASTVSDLRIKGPSTDQVIEPDVSVNLPVLLNTYSTVINPRVKGDTLT